MNEATRLADELTRAIEGDPWHGGSTAAILKDVTAEAAATRPDPNVHTIWEIVRHLTVWTAEIERRLAGHPAGEPDEGDWPAPGGSDEAAWGRDVGALFEAHRRLIATLEPITDAALFGPVNDPRDRPVGSGVSHYVMLHGLAQHHAYHSGQIALLRKMC